MPFTAFSRLDSAEFQRLYSILSARFFKLWNTNLFQHLVSEM